MEAISLFAQKKYDLVLLDILLPKIDGYGVCELIRKQSQIPIVMLTALDSEADQIKGLDLQVDDYITKPFSMPILKRKIAAILRRTAGYTEADKYLHYKNKSFPICRTISYYIEAYTLINRSFEFHFMKTV